MTVPNTPTRTIPVYPGGLRKEDRPNSTDAAERQKRDGMAWRFMGLDDWTTVRIFETFGALGIPLDEPRFRELALRYRSIEELAQTWDENFSVEDLWSDFPFLGAQALWRRITPDIASPETIADVLQTCADLLDGIDRDPETIKTHLKVFTDYLTAFPESEIPEQYEAIQRSLLTDIVWICSTAISLFGDNDPEEAARINHIVQLASPPGGAILLGDMALITARQGNIEDARALLAEQLRREPDAPETYLTAAAFANHVGDYEGMVEHAVKALTLEKDPSYWNTIYTRLAKMFMAAGRQSDLDAVKGRIRIPREPLAPAAISHVPAQSTRVGRNDPCPCGSGKKYKKCHG
ncbi:MAG: SEC-C metal-binding domain-containing protein [Capsulimonas sp.]